MTRSYNEKRGVRSSWSSIGMETTRENTMRKTYRKRWIDVVEEDLNTLGVTDLREIIQNRDGWRSVVMAEKRLESRREEEELIII